MYIVRYHMPDTGIMLLLTEHIGNELKQKFFVVVVVVVVVVKLQCGWFWALQKCKIVKYLS